MKKKINRIINLFGYSLVKLNKINKLLNSDISIEDINFINEFKNNEKEKILELLKISKSQQFQDILALYANNFTKNGFYVEIGVGDGFQNSNTYILENDFNWKGILVEPSKQYHKSLAKRKGLLEKKLVYKSDNEQFQFYQNGQLSTIEKYINSDHHSARRKKDTIYSVDSISIETLLKKYNAPKMINYISIDTEGSEFDIIENFNFNMYDIKFVTIEHNFNDENRKKIRNLMKKFGYKIFFEKHSLMDDFFIK